MNGELNTLIVGAAGLAFVHTLFGPDHYLPFVMMSWSRKWSWFKTAWITFLCGVGHIVGSVVLGFVGVAVGIAVNKVEMVEGVRGNLAAWLLIAFGLVYLVWGLRRAYRNKPHEHEHAHLGEETHTHTHVHHEEHTHVHDHKAAVSIAPWTLFIIFAFGPCEVLIPLLMYPAAEIGIFGVAIVTAVFAVITVATMVGAVLVARAGISFVPVAKVQRFTHVIAGATICLCGLAIQFLGL
ncbi:MAG: sulfite exporter TauE/SafE family protein [Planctomycetota bacterium]